MNRGNLRCTRSARFRRFSSWFSGEVNNKGSQQDTFQFPPKATEEKEFQCPWREDGPQNHLGDKEDPEQLVVCMQNSPLPAEFPGSQIASQTEAVDWTGHGLYQDASKTGQA